MAHLMKIQDGQPVEGSYQNLPLKTKAFEFSSSDKRQAAIEAFGLHLPDDMVLFLTRDEIMSLHRDLALYMNAKSHGGRIIDTSGKRLS